MLDIIPGILEKDGKELERKIALVAPHAPWVQIDIGDNTLFPCESVHDMNVLIPIIQKFVRLGVKFEAHLMVGKPRDYITDLVNAGFSRIIAHVECDDPREFMAEARVHETEVGLAIDVDTEIEVIEPMLEEIDVLLVMTVETGSSGQIFEPEAVEKIKVVRRNLPELPIEVDGGMNPASAKIVKEAGAERVVSTSYLFNTEHNIEEALETLQTV